MVDLLGVDDEGRFPAEDSGIVEGVGNADAFLHQGRDGDFADFVLGELDSDHETASPDVTEDGWVAGLDLFESVQHPLAHFLGVLDELGCELRKGGEAGGAGEGVSTEGGRVDHRVFAVDLVVDVFGIDGDAEGHDSAADGFGEGHDVGGDAFVVAGKGVAGAAKAALDFVEDEERAVLVARLAGGLEVAVGRDDNAAFTLNGFEDDAGGLVVDGIDQGVDVAVVDELDSGHEREKLLAVLLPASGGEGSEGFSVVATIGGDDFCSSGCAFGKLEGGFDGFGPGVAEEGELEVAGGDCGDRR